VAERVRETCRQHALADPPGVRRRAEFSLFFYSLSALAKPLSTLWLVREMFKQSHNTVDARIGRPVPFDVYSATASPRGSWRACSASTSTASGRGRPIFRSVETVRPRKTACSCARNWPRRAPRGDT
jgi:hypothetical protein